jgi:hypothetical protein
MHTTSRLLVATLALFASLPAFAADELCGDIRISQKVGLAAWRTVYEGVIRRADPMEIVLNYRHGRTPVGLTVELRPHLTDSGDGLELNVFRSVDVNGRSYLARSGVGTTALDRGDLGYSSVSFQYRLSAQYQIFGVQLSNVHFCN